MKGAISMTARCHWISERKVGRLAMMVSLCGGAPLTRSSDLLWLHPGFGTLYR